MFAHKVATTALLLVLLATDWCEADIGITLGRGRGGGGGGGGGGGAGGPPQPYSFQYSVRDPPSGNDFGQQEAGDAQGAVRGEYRVRLPDGRTQVVTYTANDAQGYIADVKYEG